MAEEYSPKSFVELMTHHDCCKGQALEKICETFPDAEVSKAIRKAKDKFGPSSQTLRYLDKLARWGKDAELVKKLAETCAKYSSTIADKLAYELVDGCGSKYNFNSIDDFMKIVKHITDYCDLLLDGEIAALINNYEINNSVLDNKCVPKSELPGDRQMYDWCKELSGGYNITYVKEILKALSKFDTRIVQSLIGYYVDTLTHKFNQKEALQLLEKMGDRASKYDFVDLALLVDFEDSEVFDRKYVHDALVVLHEKDKEKNLQHIVRSIPRSAEYFGKYFESLMDYFERRTPLYTIETLQRSIDTVLCHHEEGKTFKKNLTDFIESSNFGDKLGNKKIKPLIDLVNYSVKFLKLDLNIDFTKLDKTCPSKAAEQLGSQLKDTFCEKYGFKLGKTDDLPYIADYIPYLKCNDSLSDLIRFAFSETYVAPIPFVVQVNPEKLGVDFFAKVHSDLQELIPFYKEVIGKDISFEKKEDINYYANIATELLDNVKKWKGNNAGKLEENADALSELKNLERLANLKDRSNKIYKIVFSPKDYKAQLISLVKAQSCLSPNDPDRDSNFNRYSKRYLTETDNHVFFATITDLEDRIVGRATVAQGYDPADSNKKYYARISRVYGESTGITAEIFDKALAQFAKSNGDSILPKGQEMTVPGIGSDAYDDCVIRAGENRIKVDSLGRAYS